MRKTGSEGRSLASRNDATDGSTFLSIRIRQNPKHYKGAMVKDHTRSWDATLDRFVEVSY